MLDNDNTLPNEKVDKFHSVQLIVLILLDVQMREMSNQGYESLESINNTHEILNEAKDEVKFKIYGYIESRSRTFLYNLFSLCLIGIPYIVVNFYPRLKTLTYQKCSLDRATIILVSDSDGKYSWKQITYEKITHTARPLFGEFRYFFYQHTKYVWSTEHLVFVTLGDLIPTLTNDEYLNNTDGLKKEEYENRLNVYGKNELDIKIKSYWTLFIEEVITPFYFFQVFSVCLWLYDEYIAYAICIFVLTLFSSFTSIIQIRKQLVALHALVESSKCHEVTVCRQTQESNQDIIKINAANLVPGDLIVLPAANLIMPCDAVLLTGQCIVNESMLTGESVPITKTALQSNNEQYNMDTQKRHTLFSGTNVMQTRYYGGEHVLARVIRTGFDTTKGSLVKSILYQPPVGSDFYKDSFKFVLVLLTVAAAGMGYCMYLYISRGAAFEDIIVRTLDVITIVVPPALPAAMAIGTSYSQSRLKTLGIFCVSPPRINICGKIKLACFDKTGTLTHDSLNMNSIVPSVDGRFSLPIDNVAELDVESKFVQGMATCHSLTRIDNKLNGDPLDINMFEFTKWDLDEPGDDENTRFDMLAPTVVMPGRNIGTPGNSKDLEMPYEIGIIKQFTFSSTTSCMTVICRDLRNPRLMAFTKGAPEKLHGMCIPESVPEDFNSSLSQFTSQGYRVIALGYKDLPHKFRWKEAQSTKRSVIECDLIFLGFLIMYNPLKTETAPCIRTLHQANIKTAMITGDNILTAISVAYECGMVNTDDQVYIISMENTDDSPEKVPKVIIEKAGTSSSKDYVSLNLDNNDYHFALDGKTWNKLRYFYPDVIPSILVRTTIFARFQPDQKTQLIMSFQNLDYIVSMVGDGANDCGALRAAHVGVSLSQAEASVAAPFTSSIADISCLVYLILEGRCALVTSFAIFKYMAVYSLIQFFSVLILYRQHSNMGDYQFLYIDLIITTILPITIGLQGPSNKLGTKSPMKSLVSVKNTAPLILQIAVCAFIQVSVIFYLYQQPWFEPVPIAVIDPVIDCWESTVLFLVSCFQYIVLATVYSKGLPFRQRLITNFWFLISALGLTIFTTWLVIFPCKQMAELMDVVFVHRDEKDKLVFRYTLLLFPLIHVFIAVFIELGISDRKWLNRCFKILKCKRKSKNKYKLLLKDSSYRPLNFDEQCHDSMSFTSRTSIVICYYLHHEFSPNSNLLLPQTSDLSLCFLTIVAAGAV
ncbi:unnamed protein product [Phaedon cochleariae]|uniref:Cation-transporting ATPase n=1 Tax=Phaedon cochleariae TaxID=80249 RepID=A0A9P0DT09_PHACE|nr:unnamed protein product [Phaedon cochleariae]